MNSMEKAHKETVEQLQVSNWYQHLRNTSYGITYSGCSLTAMKCPLPGSVQGQVGRGFEPPGLVEGVPARGRGVGTRWSIRSLPTQTIP